MSQTVLKYFAEFKSMYFFYYSGDMFFKKHDLTEV